MTLPWVAIASDGSAINLDAPGVPHPRNYSTNPRVLGNYVREQKVLTLPEAVRKMTSLPARILGLKDRGQLREGLAADIVVFDPARVGETNSFAKPKSYPEGIPYVLVNGALVIDKGQHTGARPGKALRGPGTRTRSTSALDEWTVTAESSGVHAGLQPCEADGTPDSVVTRHWPNSSSTHPLS